MYGHQFLPMDTLAYIQQTLGRNSSAIKQMVPQGPIRLHYTIFATFQSLFRYNLVKSTGRY